MVATLKGEDKSYFHNVRPYILATTVQIRTPMKIQIMNQNLSKLLHGSHKGETIDYIVRFESEMNLTDFGWVLPTQNKPKRLRQTKITDFNNVLRGNPYFTENIDLLWGKEERWRYMQKGDSYDVEAVKKLENFKKVGKF